MVAVAEAAGGEALPPHVVLPVRRGEHHGAGPGELEEHAPERGQPRRVEVLDHLDHGRGVEAGEARVAIHERAVEQLQALLLRGGQAVVPKLVRGHFQGAVGDLEAEDAGELPFPEQQAQQPSLAAAEVEHGGRAARLEHGEHGAEALLVERRGLGPGVRGPGRWGFAVGAGAGRGSFPHGVGPVSNRYAIRLAAG